MLQTGPNNLEINNSKKPIKSSKSSLIKRIRYVLTDEGREKMSRVATIERKKKEKDFEIYKNFVNTEYESYIQDESSLERLGEFIRCIERYLEGKYDDYLVSDYLLRKENAFKNLQNHLRKEYAFKNLQLQCIPSIEYWQNLSIETLEYGYGVYKKRLDIRKTHTCGYNDGVLLDNIAHLDENYRYRFPLEVIVILQELGFKLKGAASLLNNFQ